MGVTWAGAHDGGAAWPPEAGGTGGLPSEAGVGPLLPPGDDLGGLGQLLPLDPMLATPSFTVGGGGGSTMPLNFIEDLAANLTTLASSDNCSLQLSVMDQFKAQEIVVLGVLLIINVLVVAGNCLVIAAVFLSSKLRKVTNLFIVSLAVADLMLGMAVLPFSITVEVFSTWFFGDLWCSVWLAVDVWMSTASILNLCAISLDRYVAVTRPVSYPSLMTSTRAKILIALVWVTSFLICFPPLVGWNDRQMSFQQSTTSSIVNSDLGITQVMNISLDSDFTCKCQLTDERGYVVYSALGSFFIPMLVMMFFYWKIYCAAAETTRAINQGFRTTKGKELLGDPYEEKRLTLRIHRGKQSDQGDPGRHYRTASQRSNNFVSSYPKSHKGKQYSLQMQNLKPSTNLKESLSLPPVLRYDANNYKPSNQCTATICAKTDCKGHHPTLELMPSPTSNCHEESCFTVDSNLSEIDTPNMQRPKKLLSNTSSCSSATSQLHPNSSGNLSRNIETTRLRPNNSTTKMGRRNIKVQVKRFKMETKAAKTLGIIVGVFILCWFPFFTMYLVWGFCQECIPSTLFSILFWLGYCNSALNPCIYALFSKDFRYAFKNILCRCICTREKSKVLQNLHLTYNAASLGDDRDESDES